MEIQTLSAVFEPGDRAYTFMVPDTLAAEVSAGDYMLVDTTAGYRVVIVQDVHGEDRRDPKLTAQGVEFKWAFAKVDLTPLEDLKAVEALMG